MMGCAKLYIKAHKKTPRLPFSTRSKSWLWTTCGQIRSKNLSSRHSQSRCSAQR